MENKSLNQLQKELDEIITWFESADVDIDKAVPKYEKGLKVAAEIKLQLTKTENKITKIKQSFDKAGK